MKMADLHEDGRLYRIEKDVIGEGRVPKEAYYGLQTLRAVENFDITGQKPHPDMIRSLVRIKKAAAIANQRAGTVPPVVARAIVQACEEILDGALLDQFIVDSIQGGAGTSLNMNANEVIANRALELLGHAKGDYARVNPNDHVNCGQSTNDVIPTAGRMTCQVLLGRLADSLVLLEGALHDKAVAFDDIVKMGRTQLQDAVPIRLGQSFAAYAHAVARSGDRMRAAIRETREVNLGGTAIGTGVNADAQYIDTVVDTLRAVSGLDLVPADDRIDATQNLDAFVSISGTVKACAVSLSKMSSDLRLLASGPRTGFGEINLPPRQNGSSIMPGKVNPVMPEVLNQVAFLVIGNDQTITLAAEAGQLELNAFEPVLFHCLFQSIDALTRAIRTFVEHCVVGITANADRCRRLVDDSVGVVTALCPAIGYGKATDIAKEAIRSGRSVRDLVMESGLLAGEDVARMLDPMRMCG